MTFNSMHSATFSWSNIKKYSENPSWDYTNSKFRVIDDALYWYNSGK
jgi:hypothetical protein